MMNKLQHLKTLLEQLQSVTKPVDEEATAPLPEWAEAMTVIDELLAEKPSSGTGAIAEAVKGLLDQHFPGAQLADVPANGAGRLVVFSDKNDYLTIEIRE